MTKDIQAELYKLTNGMAYSNVYSQLAYFMVELALCDERHSDAYGISMIIGLISDTYFGKMARGYANDERIKQSKKER